MGDPRLSDKMHALYWWLDDLIGQSELWLRPDWSHCKDNQLKGGEVSQRKAGKVEMDFTNQSSSITQYNEYAAGTTL